MNAIFKKLNFQNQKVIHIVNGPESFGPALEEMKELAAVKSALGKSMEFVIGFAMKQVEVDRMAEAIGKACPGDGVVWIAYPKGTSKKYKCDFNRDTGWKRMGEMGFEPVRQVAIDEDWSELRFRRDEHIKTMTRSFAMTEKGKKKAGLA